MFIVIPIADLVIDPINPVDASALPADEVIRRVKVSMGSLGDEVTISVDKGIVTITLPDPTTSAQQRAKEFTNRGIDYGTKGQYAKALDAFKKAVMLDTTNVIARRNLAMAQLESGMTQEAEDNLIQVLALAPTDADALILLGNIFANNKNDDATAGRMYEKALKLKPDNVTALVNLGGIIGKSSEEFERAEKLFNRAIEVDPSYPNSYYGFAYLCSKQGRIERGLVALNDLFARASPDAIRSAAIYKHGRTLYAELNEKAAEKSLPMVTTFIEDRKRELEAASDCAIDIAEDATMQDQTSITRMAWRHHKQRHEIVYRANISHVVLPHVIAHELEHIQLELDARAVRRNMTFRTTKVAMEKTQQNAGEFLEYLRRKGITGAQSDFLMKKLVDGMCSMLYNNPLDMIIESRLFARYDILRPAQWMSLEKQNRDNLLVFTTEGMSDSAPRMIYGAGVTLNAVFAIFTDHLYQGKTDYAEPYKSSDVWSTAQKLFEAWLHCIASFEPGDEFELIREFSRILEFDRWFNLELDEPAEFDGGATNPELLKEKEGAAVMYLVGAISRLSKLTKKEIEKLGFEIALLGQHGIDYTKPDARYSLRFYPGEKFTGLQLVCLMYVCWQDINPSLSMGVDFADEYAMAKKIVDSK